MADHFSETDISYFFEIYRRYASSDQGVLLLKDIPTVMLHLGHNPTVNDLEKLTSAIEIGDRGFIDFPEFLTMLAFHVQEVEPEENLRKAFKIFDEDGNGSLSAQELKKAMATLGEKLSREEIEFMITTADVDGDGQINYEEFIRFMLSK